MTHTCEIMGIRSPACVLTGSVLALCRRNGSLLLSRPVPANRCVYFPLCPLSHTAYVIEIPQVLFDLTRKLLPQPNTPLGSTVRHVVQARSLSPQSDTPRSDRHSENDAPTVAPVARSGLDPPNARDRIDLSSPRSVVLNLAAQEAVPPSQPSATDNDPTRAEKNAPSSDVRESDWPTYTT